MTTSPASSPRPRPDAGPATAGGLLALVRSGEAVTRAELGRVTGLSRTAVTARVSSLLEAGLLRAGSDAVTGGRPAEALEVDPRAGCVLGLAVGRSRTQLGVFDLHGTRLAEASTEHDLAAGGGPAMPPGILLPEVAARGAALLQDSGQPGSPLVAVGLSVPGTVDDARGMVLESPVLPGWDQAPLAPLLPPVLGAETGADGPLLVLGNDANVLAAAELAADPGLRDALVVKASTGLGLGVISGGRILIGSHGAAGDLGHIKVPAGAGRTCRCGATGCLETVAAGWALLEQIPAGERPAHVRDLVAAARQGDVRARGLVRQSGRMLGDALAGVATLLDPRAIVLAGDMANDAGGIFDLYASGVRETLYAQLPALTARGLELLPSRFADQAGLVGCAAMALDRWLSPGAVDARLARARRAAG